MSDIIASMTLLPAALLLAACGQAEENTPEAKAFAKAQDDDRIPCARGDAAL